MKGIFRCVLSACAASVFGLSSMAYAAPATSPTDPNPKRFDALRAEAIKADQDAATTRAQLNPKTAEQNLSTESQLPTDQNPKRFDALHADAQKKSAALDESRAQLGKNSVASSGSSLSDRKVPTDQNPKRYDAHRVQVTK